MFHYDEKEKKIDFSHNPFSMPQTEIEDFDQIDVEIDKENNAFFLRSKNFQNLYWSSLAQKLDLKKGK